MSIPIILAVSLIVIGAAVIAWSVVHYRGTDDFSGAVPYLGGWCLLLIGLMIGFVAVLLAWRS